LPAIGRSFSADAAGLQWIINSYLLPLGALLLLGGAAGDRYGKRRIFVTGIFVFGLGSLSCAISPNLNLLLVSRLVQGFGAAMLLPNSLAILGQTFSGEKRGRAVGVWASAGAIGSAIGPVLGGWLIDHGSWRDIFLINVPLAAAGAVLAWRCIPRDVNPFGHPLDVLGGALVTIGLSGIAWALTNGSGMAGWTGLTLLTASAASLALILFTLAERRAGDGAMMPLTLFGSRSFVGLSVLTLLLYGALSGLFVLIPYVLIEADGYTATQAGASLLPFPVILALASPFMAGLTSRIETRVPLALGPLIVGFGLLLMSRVALINSYWTELFPAIIVVSIGMSLAVAPLTTAVLNSVDAQHTGSASGFNSALSRSGGLMAIALLGSVLATHGSQLVERFHVATGIEAATCAIAAVCAYLLIGSSPRADTLRPKPGASSNHG
jgi:EmrB/QacA subfamily drug resistance transporter